ncbi:MAG TPA: hypothetical protein PK530_02515 [Anaerolineales bacterium]|nr:hypothetical protein [Anaerolineales bacterium]
MDPVKILKRSWQILWSYRALWVFGLILALAGAGSSGRGSNSNYKYDSDSPRTQGIPEDMNMKQAFEQLSERMDQFFREGYKEVGLTADEWTALFWIVGVFIVFSVIMGIVLAFARYVSETAVIRMVDEYEGTGAKMTVRQGFRLGWSRTSWRLFLINLLVNLPAILTMLLFLVFGVTVYMAFTRGTEQTATATTAILVGIFLLVLLVVILVSIFLNLLRNFFWRVCVLEEVGVRESIRRGFQMARANWKNVGVMWLVMIGIGILWAIVSIIAMVVTLPLVLVTGVAGALVMAVRIPKASWSGWRGSRRRSRRRARGAARRRG